MGGFFFFLRLRPSRPSPIMLCSRCRAASMHSHPPHPVALPPFCSRLIRMALPFNIPPPPPFPFPRLVGRLVVVGGVRWRWCCCLVWLVGRSGCPPSSTTTPLELCSTSISCTLHVLRTPLHVADP